MTKIRIISLFILFSLISCSEGKKVEESAKATETEGAKSEVQVKATSFQKSEIDSINVESVTVLSIDSVRLLITVNSDECNNWNPSKDQIEGAINKSELITGHLKQYLFYDAGCEVRGSIKINEANYGYIMNGGSFTYVFNDSSYFYLGCWECSETFLLDPEPKPDD